MNTKLLLSLFFVFLLIQNVSAMGLRAPVLKETLFYEPNFEKEYEISFYTNSGITQNYEIYTRMHTDLIDLTEYVTLEETFVAAVPTNRLVPFRFKLELPSEIPIPGIHEIRVGVKELPVSGGGVGAVTASEMRIIIIVLSPGHNIVSAFSVPNGNVDEDMTFSFHLNNYGTANTVVRGDVKVFDLENNLVGAALTDSITILSTQNLELPAKFSTEGFLPSNYVARGTLYWHDQAVEFAKGFRIGSPTAIIHGMTSEFVNEAINKVKIDVESGWNNKVSNVFATVNVFSPDSNIPVKTFTTPGIKLDPWQRSEILGYFDTTDLELGKYKAELGLMFEGREIKKSFDIEISEMAETETVEEIPGQFNFLSVEFLLGVIIALLLTFICLSLFILRGVSKKRIKDGK